MLLIQLLVQFVGEWEFFCWARNRKGKLGTGSAARLAWHWYMRSMGSSIPLSEKLQGPMCFPHSMKGIFISGDAVIGPGCTIYQQVTIGSNAAPGSRGLGYPLLGKDILIGAGAKVIGNVRIGDRVRIGANVVVVQDIPDDATVVLPPMRVIVGSNDPQP